MIITEFNITRQSIIETTTITTQEPDKLTIIKSLQFNFRSSKLNNIFTTKFCNLIKINFIIENAAVSYYENFDIDNIVTPINVGRLKHLLEEAGYEEEKTKFLIDGFTDGFDLGYRGPKNRKNTAINIPLRVAMKTNLWNKFMEEVKVKRFAGPFKTPLYENYIQSPIGLVLKAGNKNKT